MTEKDNNYSKQSIKTSGTPRKRGFWEQVKPDFNLDLTTMLVHLIKDIGWPALLDTAYNFGTTFLSDLIYGNRSNPQRSYARSNDSPRYINYADRYRGVSKQPQRYSVYDYTEFEYDSRYDAEVTLYRLKEILATSTQKCVTVGDYIEESQRKDDPNRIHPTSVDYDYGWTSLDHVDIRPGRTIRDENGTIKTLWYLALPKPVAIER